MVEVQSVVEKNWKPTTKELCWLAGILEGEGSFYLQTHHRYSRKLNYYPKHAIIKVSMTDLDIIEKVHNILGSNHKIQSSKQNLKSGKILYTSKICGFKAIQWMMTLYSLMGNRRKLKIEECLLYWKDHTECRVDYRNKIATSIRLYNLNDEGKLVETIIR